MASSPDNDGTGQNYRMARVRQVRREGVREEPASSRPLSFPPAQTRWIRAGSRCALAPWKGWGRGTPGPVSGRRSGGHGECLRRNRGEAAGVQLGTSPDNRFMVNVGTIPGPPLLVRMPCGPIREGASSADGPGWGGGPVVVRAGESPCAWRRGPAGSRTRGMTRDGDAGEYR